MLSPAIFETQTPHLSNLAKVRRPAGAASISVDCLDAGEAWSRRSAPGEELGVLARRERWGAGARRPHEG
jgi:hypothetical protein